MRRFVISLMLISCMMSLNAQDLSMYQKRTFSDESGQVLNYRILYPENYDRAKNYPLLVFLHGSGERGDDNEKQLTHGAKLFLERENRKDFPAIVVFPQCPFDDMWSRRGKTQEIGGKWTFTFPIKKEPGRMAKLVMGMIEELEKKESVDKKQEYIMGLSMGGIGTFEMLCYYPGKFKRAVAICGGHNLDAASRYAKQVPVWLFHGALDNVVPTQYSRDLYARLKELGAEVKYTEFPNDSHNSWDSTFATPELLPWIFGK